MNYRILCVEMEFFLPAVCSLKEKRGLRSKLLSRLIQRREFSAAECGEQDSLSRLQIAAVKVVLTEKDAANLGRSVIDEAEGILYGDAELIRYDIEIL